MMKFRKKIKKKKKIKIKIKLIIKICYNLKLLKKMNMLKIIQLNKKSKIMNQLQQKSIILKQLRKKKIQENKFVENVNNTLAMNESNKQEIITPSEKKGVEEKKESRN